MKSRLELKVIAVSSVPLTSDLICFDPVGKIKEDLEELSIFGLTLSTDVLLTSEGNNESRYILDFLAPSGFVAC